MKYKLQVELLWTKLIYKRITLTLWVQKEDRFLNAASTSQVLATLQVSSLIIKACVGNLKLYKFLKIFLKKA